MKVSILLCMECWATSVVSVLWPYGLWPPGSSVHGILQSRMLEWVSMPCPKGSSLPGTNLSSLLHWQAYSFTTSATWEALLSFVHKLNGRIGRSSLKGLLKEILPGVSSVLSRFEAHVMFYLMSTVDPANSYSLRFCLHTFEAHLWQVFRMLHYTILC